jgi:hypothetical protein
MIVLFTCNIDYPGIGVETDDPDLYEIMINNPQNKYVKIIDSVEQVDSFHIRTALPGETFYYYRLWSGSGGGIPSPDKGTYYTETTKSTNIAGTDSIIFSCSKQNDSTGIECATTPIKLDNGTVMYTIYSTLSCKRSSKETIINSEIGVLYTSESCYSDMDGHSCHSVLIKHNGKEINVASILNEYYSKKSVIQKK